MSLSLTANRREWGGYHGDQVRYRSEASALRAIRNGQAKPELMCRLETEPCDECGGWHVIQVPLPPEPARPPVDLDQAQRMCITKRGYTTEDRARRVAARATEARGVPIRAYPCGLCGQWHLTKAEKLG